MRGRLVAITVTVTLAIVLASASAAAMHERGDGVPCVPGESDPFVRGMANLFFETTAYNVGESRPTGPHQGDAPTVVLVYEEANGVDGIQRDDPFKRDRACGHGTDRLAAGAGCSFTVDALHPAMIAHLSIHGCVADLDPEEPL